MLVNLARIAKKRNSTLIPAGVGNTYNCKLKAGCSITHPVIELQWDGSGSPVTYNYASIQDFGARDYWIDNWTYEDRKWIASCSVDVLGTYKQDIGQASKYVLRSASEEDVDVIDTIYPSKLPVTSEITFPAFTDWATTFDGGRFVVGVIGQGNTFSAAGTGYVVLTGQQLQQLIQACFTEDAQTWQTPVTPNTDFATALNEYGEKMNKSVNNPIQFINSIVWVPFVPSTGQPTNVWLGRTDTRISAASLGDPIYTRVFAFNNLVPAGIDTTHGVWRALEPFCRYTMVFPPFGSFDLDAAMVYRKYGQIQGQVKVDCITGEATFNAYDYGLTGSARLGIPISISGASVNYMDQALAVTDAATDTVGSFLKLDIAGGIKNAAHGVADVMRASAPTATQGSIGGGMAALNSPRYVLCKWYEPVPEDNAEKGRPLCQIKTISSLSGYVVCADGEVEIQGATADELREIEAYLTGGFFYE